MPAKQLVALRCSECQKAVAAVLPECADLWCLCGDCAPSGAMRRQPEAQATTGQAAEFDAAINAAEEVADEETEARYPNGATQAEIDNEFDRAFGRAFYWELRQRGLRSEPEP